MPAKRSSCVTIDTHLHSYQRNNRHRPPPSSRRLIIASPSHTSLPFLPLKPSPRPPTLPLPRILNPFRNILTSILNARSSISQCISNGFPCAASGTCDSLTDPTGCGAGHAADCAGEAADCVAEGGGYEFGGAGYACVLVCHFGSGGCFWELLVGR